MLRRAIPLLVVTFLLLTVGALRLSADESQVFLLEGTNSSGLACSAAAPCAQVTVDVSASGTTATFTVSSLLNGYIFDSFGFNSSVTVALMAGSGTGELGSYSLGGAGNEDGWGSFDYNFDTGKNGGSNGSDCVVTSGSPGAGCTFSFQVSGTGLTLADFEVASSGDNGTTDFAGQLTSAASGGYAGDAVAPESSSLVLFGTGLIGVAVALRRLRKPAKPL